MNTRRIISLGSVFAATMFFAGAAQAVDTLVITENSSTALTAVLNGTTQLPVTNNGLDLWTVGLAGINGGGEGWNEPGALGTQGFVNKVDGNGPTAPNLTVTSELYFGVPLLPDGATDTSHYTLNGAELDVTFHDNGDVASAPDIASTLPLLGLSLAALGIFAKRRTFVTAA
jgi:hypothetical protein